MLSSFTQYYWIKLSLIVQNSSLLAKKPDPCFSFSVVGYPLRSTKNLWLGKLYLTNNLIFYKFVLKQHLAFVFIFNTIKYSLLNKICIYKF